MNLSSAPMPEASAGMHPWEIETVTIQSVRSEVPGVATYELAFQDDAAAESYRVAPGQFNMLYLPGAGEIAISVSDARQPRTSCGHTIRVAGNVTRSLATMRQGQTLGLRGPFGAGWPVAECTGRDVILVSGGIGLAPLRPMIHWLLDNRRRFGRLNLLYGARSPETLLYEPEYDEWTRRGMIVQTTVDRSIQGWIGNVGVVTLILERLRSFDPRNTVLLCCGPEVMMKFTAITALNRGMKPQQIWLAMERNMQCAIGICGHCQFGPHFLCRDGPVFRYDQVSPYLDVKGF